MSISELFLSDKLNNVDCKRNSNELNNVESKRKGNAKQYRAKGTRSRTGTC